jgi:hypothetical protein
MMTISNHFAALLDPVAILSACAQLLPDLERGCAEGQANACNFARWLHADAWLWVVRETLATREEVRAAGRSEDPRSGSGDHRPMTPAHDLWEVDAVVPAVWFWDLGIHVFPTVNKVPAVLKGISWKDWHGSRAQAARAASENSRGWLACTATQVVAPLAFSAAASFAGNASSSVRP